MTLEDVSVVARNAHWQAWANKLTSSWDVVVTVGQYAGKLGASAAGPQGFQLIWPTVQEVRDSVEGWRGGASVPGPAKNVNKPFLQPYWHRCPSQPRHLQSTSLNTVFQLTCVIAQRLCETMDCCDETIKTQDKVLKLLQ